MPPPPEPRRYAGKHSESGNLNLTLSADGGYVTEVRVSCLYCDGGNYSFVTTPTTLITVSDGRFTALDLHTDLGGDQRVDLDGVLFDADGFGGTSGQAVGGVQFQDGFRRCHFSWRATTVLDDDEDGWSTLRRIPL